MENEGYIFRLTDIICNRILFRNMAKLSYSLKLMNNTSYSSLPSHTKLIWIILSPNSMSSHRFLFSILLFYNEKNVRSSWICKNFTSEWCCQIINVLKEKEKKNFLRINTYILKKYKNTRKLSSLNLMQILIYILCFWDVSYCFMSFVFDRFDFNRSICFLFYSIFKLFYNLYK